jgi:hypothetical protein
MFSLWFLFLGDSCVFLDACPSILFLCFPPFWGALVYLRLVGFHHFSPFLEVKLYQISHKGTYPGPLFENAGLETKTSSMSFSRSSNTGKGSEWSSNN